MLFMHSHTQMQYQHLLLCKKTSFLLIIKPHDTYMSLFYHLNRSSLRERVAKDVMLIKSAANQNTYESLDADSSSQILGFSRQGLRRSMSKISIKSRKLTSRFATSTSTLTSRIQGKPVYQEVALA